MAAAPGLTIGDEPMDRYTSRSNVDRFLHLLEDVELPSDRRATVTKLLIEEEDKLARDLEQLQFAESRAASGRDRINFLRQRLDGVTENHRPALERLLANFEAIQLLLDGFCLQLRALAQSRSSL